MLLAQLFSERAPSDIAHELENADGDVQRAAHALSSPGLVRKGLRMPFRLSSRELYSHIAAIVGSAAQATASRFTAT